MRATRFALAAIGTVVLASTRPLAAQGTESSHPLEINAVVGHVTADGKDFSSTKGATAVGGALRYVFLGHLGLGLGVHYSDHGLTSLPEHLHIRVLYAEGRYSAPLGSSAITLFGGPRGGWAHEDITSVTWTANGSVIGGVAGLDWRFASQLALELQLSESAIHLGNLKGADGSVISGSAVHGTSFGVEAGLVVRF